MKTKCDCFQAFFDGTQNFNFCICMYYVGFMFICILYIRLVFKQKLTCCFQDFLNYLDSSAGTGKIAANDRSNLSQAKPQHHFQELIETEAELEKLTSTMQAFQKHPVPPPRKV